MNIFLLFTSGIMAVIPLYFADYFFLSWIAIIPAIFALTNSDFMDSFYKGWFLGLIIVSGTGYWLFYPMKLFTSLPIVLIIPALILLFSGIALFYGLWGLIISKIGIGPFRIAFSWTALEFLRYKIISAFPLGYIGYSQMDFKVILQWAELGGVFIISFFILLINGYLYYLLKHKKIRYLVAVVIIMLILVSFGGFKLNYYNNYLQNETTDRQEIGLTQTTVPQIIKWNNSEINNNIEKIFKDNKIMKKNDIKLVITPETGLTFDITRNEYYRDKILKKIKEGKSYYQVGSQSIIKKPGEVYNSSFLFSPEGKIIDRYNKNRLVVFGEVIPFNSLVNQLAGMGLSSINKGTKRSKFSTSFASWNNMICSELLYPLPDKEIKEIDFIVNQSNEAWFKSGLPRLMWAAAVFRAVENRRSVVKTGNLSYSGVILPSGKTLVKKPVNNNQPIISSIPFSDKETFFNSRYHLTGHLTVFFLFLLLMLSYFVNYKDKD